jgi:probable HAF family extracellular repeat protein
MKHHRNSIRALIAILSFVVLATAAEAQDLKFKFTTIVVKGAKDTHLDGVNNSGEMVGWYVAKNGAAHGLLLVKGKATNIDDPNGSNTICYDINSNGAIVGSYLDSNSLYHAFLFQNGSFTEIVPPSSTQPQATGINDSGDIVGVYCDNSCSAGHQHGFRFNGSTYTRLDAPGAAYSWAWGINNNGLITVEGGNSKGIWSGYLYDGTKYTKLKVPGAVDTYPRQIDSAGDVVLTWDTSPSGKFHAALFSQGKYYKFDDQKGTSGTSTNGINDNSLIVGNTFTNGGNTVEGYKASY